MGYDVYGYKNKVYFRNNIWGWRPLWSYVCSLSEDILSKKDMLNGNFNDGYHISKTKTKQIIKILEKELERNKIYKNSDFVKIILKYVPEQLILSDSMIFKMNEDTNCLGYEFNTENVRDFLEFLKKTKGGFIIC